MSRRFFLLVAVFIILTALFAPAQVAPTRVLFIGNSYTYFNNMPEIFATLARASRRPVEIRVLAPGGWGLKDHWESAEALHSLRESHWDYVVLQDQSTLGTNLFLNGDPRIAGDSEFRSYAEKFAEEVHRAGATPVLYLTWARQTVPEDQPALNYAYSNVAKLTRSRVAPVGVAWARVRREQPHVQLFAPDGSHPSREGSYLAACTIFATLFMRSPEGLPAKATGASVGEMTGKMESKTMTLVDLPLDIAHYLQTAAWVAWQQLNKKGYLDLPPVAAPALPPLPEGMPIAPADLVGIWSGNILFFPGTGPVPVTLQFRRDGESWTGHLDLKFGPKDFPAESVDLAQVIVGERLLTFSDPSSAGVAKGKIEFRAVITRSHQLRGVAESTLNGRNGPVRILGTFQLKK